MRKLTATASSLAVAVVAAASLTAAPAQADGLGQTSLAEVLAADGLEFDETWTDFDILDQAVNDVIAAKPNSAVAVLADGSVRLTAFAPTDRAFRRLVEDITGSKPDDEASAYDTLSTVGVDTIESILLYHVVPGAPIDYRSATKAGGAKLETANGKRLEVDYRKKKGLVYLVDKDRNDKNAFVLRPAKNINKGNRQIAHGVSAVLRPVDL
ncbi:fasciclin domain-containing protein [Nocardioides sp. GXQ0305]|uniref:fasciclin domain-containing protein n=1 Tax=Nocardioides sp. GXQ0305 TaxID=3423912 RepID=UPI003D7CDD2F